MKAAILVAEGVQELDFIGAVEVFGASKIVSPEKNIEPVIVGVKPGASIWLQISETCLRSLSLKLSFLLEL